MSNPMTTLDECLKGVQASAARLADAKRHHEANIHHTITFLMRDGKELVEEYLHNHPTIVDGIVKSAMRKR